MKKETTQLIESLAKELGTTAEYLWTIMVNQTPVYVASTLIEILLTAVFGVVLFKLNKKFSKEIEKSERDIYDNKNLYVKLEAALGAPMIIGLLVFVGLSLAALLSVNDMITAIFNPEYWALKQILYRM